MRKFTIAAAVLAAAIATPVMAGDVATAESAALELREGLTLRDSNMSRLGKITRVFDDGSVQIILGSRFVVVPGSTLTAGENGVQTSLSKSEVRKLK